MARRRVDGYVRVSRIGGRPGDGYISPEVQREQIQAFAGLMGVEIDAWHDDRPLSRDGAPPRAVIGRVRVGCRGSYGERRRERGDRAVAAIDSADVSAAL